MADNEIYTVMTILIPFFSPLTVTVGTSLAAIFGSVGGLGILLLIAVITAFIVVFKRRQRAIKKFDLREGAKNPKTEVIEMLEEDEQKQAAGKPGAGNPFSRRLTLDDGAGGLDNMYALSYELNNPIPDKEQESHA